jgi:hypothetical protein
MCHVAQMKSACWVLEKGVEIHLEDQAYMEDNAEMDLNDFVCWWALMKNETRLWRQ